MRWLLASVQLQSGEKAVSVLLKASRITVIIVMQSYSISTNRASVLMGAGAGVSRSFSFRMVDDNLRK